MDHRTAQLRSRIANLATTAAFYGAVGCQSCTKISTPAISDLPLVRKALKIK